MTLFDVGAVLFQAGICITAVELIGQWLLLPAAFRVGPSIASFEELSGCPAGLATPRRDQSLTLMYRVLPGNISVFRQQWSGWVQSPFSMHGRASWANGRLSILARHPAGPWIAMLGIMVVSTDATIGFLRQGQPLSAALAALLFGGTAVLVPLFSYLRARARFAEVTSELRTELGYRAREGGR